MKKSDRKQDNRIKITGIILAAAVIVACIFGYQALENYIETAAERSREWEASLSEKMQQELAANETSAPLITQAAPNETQAAQPDGAQLTVFPETQMDTTVTPTMDPQVYWETVATPTPAEPASAFMTDPFQAETSGYGKVTVAYASATSALYEEGFDNSGAMAFDGDIVTSWQEGVEGYGEGQILYATFDRTYYLAYITFHIGNWRDTNHWRLNARPATATLWISGVGYEITFTDDQTEFCLAFSREVRASELSMVINTVFPGESQDFTDTCIAEIEIYGR